MAGLVGLAGLLAALTATVGLGATGWAAGVAAALGTVGLLGRGLARSGAVRLGPANRVTLIRAVLACGVAALVADGLAGGGHGGRVVALVLLASVTLSLDAVDGRVARRTGTVSPLGARFDMEVDAFLILVLSVEVAPAYGAWVLLIGAARYLLLAAKRVWPWLRAPLPPRPWCKVVAAVQGVVLAVAASGLPPHRVTTVALLAALALLAESFGREVWWLWRRRHAVPPPQRPVLAAAGHLVAGVVVWAALVAPADWSGTGPAALVRIPLEGLLLVSLVLLVPHRLGRALAGGAGLVLALLVLVRVLDAAFVAALDRPFDLAYDWEYADSAVGLLRDSVGAGAADAALVLALVAGAAVLLGVPAAVLRVTALAARHRTASARTVTALGLAWLLAAVLGLQAAPGAPVASSSTAGLAYDRVGMVRSSLRDQREFMAALTDDPLAGVPASRLLTGLRGHDVLVVFVESYGRVALDDPAATAHVGPALDRGDSALRAAGYRSRSAFLTSPTFGGLSWLAHSTLQSGLRVDHARRYDALLGSGRSTLASAFGRAGWRTVAAVPSNREPWPEGQGFYGWDRIYAAADLGYAGPEFGYASMPDQYLLDAFARRELAGRDRRPVMAELDLVSSHTPWAPLPTMVPWDVLGDGSVYDGMPARGDSAATVWRSGSRVRDAYGRSVAYSLDAVTSFLARAPGDPVVVLLGDHQPAAVVTGRGSDHDVPVTVLARDPAVLRRVDRWGWSPGLRPPDDAAVWPMEDFRDRFVTAFGPVREQTEPTGAPPR